MAGVAESHVVGLIFDEQAGLGRSVGLMAGETTEGSLDLALIGRIEHIGHGVIFDRMAEAEAEGQDGHLVLLVVVVGELDGSVEDGEQVVGFVALGNGVGPVTLEAERVALGAEKMIVIAAMGGVAGGAALKESGLMMGRLLAEFVDIAVASETDGDGVGLGQAGLVAGVGAVAIGAVARGSGMRHFGVVDELALVLMAGEAEGLGIGLGQDDFSIFCRGMTGVATVALEGHMLELREQFGGGRLVGVVALHAIGGGEGLVVMRFLDGLVAGVVAIEAERGSGLDEMETILGGGIGAGLVGEVARVATGIERGVAAALVVSVQAGFVAIEAEVFLFSAGYGLEELILVFAHVRIVTGKAVANCRGMHGALDVGGLLVGVAGEAKTVGCRSDELDVGDIFIDPDFMAAQTAGGHGGMNGLAPGFVLVALETLFGVDVLIERDGMNRREKARRQTQDADHERGMKRAAVCIEIKAPNGSIKQTHGDSKSGMLHESSRYAGKRRGVATCT